MCGIAGQLVRTANNIDLAKSTAGMIEKLTHRGPDDMGIWKGYNQLSSNDLDHFDTFELDYFYYGGPNYYNCYYPNSEMSEAEMAREDGSAIIKRINRYDF